MKISSSTITSGITAASTFVCSCTLLALLLITTRSENENHNDLVRLHQDEMAIQMSFLGQIGDMKADLIRIHQDENAKQMHFMELRSEASNHASMDRQVIENSGHPPQNDREMQENAPIDSFLTRHNDNGHAESGIMHTNIPIDDSRPGARKEEEKGEGCSLASPSDCKHEKNVHYRT